MKDDLISNIEASEILKNAERLINYDINDKICYNTLKSESQNFYKAIDMAICLLDSSDIEFCEFIKQKFQ